MQNGFKEENNSNNKNDQISKLNSQEVIEALDVDVQIMYY